MLAFGDSITNGGGELQWGVALQSWALWVSRALGLPYTGYAVDGARASDLVAAQIPALARLGAYPDARYEVGCLYVGVNDVRALDWDVGRFERDYAEALRFLAARCDRTLALTIPLGLGIPPAGAKVGQANAVIERLSGDHGALTVDLTRFGARNQVMADRVHPTAFGQVAIAERALAVLAGDGLPTRVAPAALIAFKTTRWGRLRGDLTYVYRSAKQCGRAAAQRRRVNRRSDRTPQ